MKEGEKPLPIAADPEPVAGVVMDAEELFRRHHGLVFRAAYRVTGNAADAEDVLQTVFLRLMRRDADSPAVSDAAGYLHRAAVNASLDLLRSRRQCNFVPLEEVEPRLAGDSSRAAEGAQSALEIREWLRQTVARLSPLAAEIFVLRFFEEKGYAEIARLVGTTESTVAVTLHRARERVWREFEAYMGGKS